MTTRKSDGDDTVPFVTGAVPVPIEEDNTPLPTRIPLGARPPPPPLYEGKLLSLRSGSQLQLRSLAKLRLLRIDDLAEPGDDKRWLSPSSRPPRAVVRRDAASRTLQRDPVTIPAQASVSADALVPLAQKELVPHETEPRPTFRWLRLAPPGGSQTDISAAQLCGWAVATGYTGCLWLSPETDLKRRDVPARELFFDAGVLIGARSQLIGDALVDVQGGLWSTAQRKRAHELLRKVRGDGLRAQLDLLVASKLLDAKDFPQRQADYVVELVCRALVPQRGTFRLLGTELPPGEQTMLPLQPRLLLLHAIRRGMPLDVLTSIVGPLSTILVPTNLALPQVGGVVLQNLGLSQPEEDVLLSFDGDRSLQDIFSATGIGEHSLYGLSFCLLTLGALVHPHNLSQDDRKKLLVLRQARARAKAQSEAMAVVQKKARLSETADYFTLLGVPAGASIEEVEAAYARERAAIAPAGLPQRSRATMERELRQIAMVLDEAYAVLADPVLRACYAPTAKRLPE